MFRTRLLTTPMCRLRVGTRSIGAGPQIKLTPLSPEDNKVNRPLSPHLSIYKIQLTTSLSILHRATGVAASGVLYTCGIGALFMHDASFPEILNMVQENIPNLLIVAGKTAIGGSLIYHTLNGIRHLVWDFGHGFQLKQLYYSGYVVAGLTAIGTFLIFIKG